MIVLTNTQKQNILNYVEDKTYTNRIGFSIGVVMFFICLIFCALASTDSESFYDYLIGSLMGLMLVICTFKDILRFRNVQYHIDNNSFVATKKHVKGSSISKTVQETDYSDSLKDSTLYRNSEAPRNFKLIIHKYYIFDKYGNRYECIKYLDYKKCIEKGEFISVDFPTGEKFAFCE